MKIHLRKAGKFLVPDNEHEAAMLDKFAYGTVLSAEIKRPRNYQFHKKAFALMNYAFDCWEPGIPDSRHAQVEKNFDQFREDMTILAGYYEQYVRVDGSIRTVAKSWSFGSMSQDEFDAMYDALCRVVLKHILTNYSRDDLDRVMAEIERFAA